MSTYINHIKQFFVLGEKSKKQHGMPLRKLTLTQKSQSTCAPAACMRSYRWLESIESEDLMDLILCALPIREGVSR